MHQVLYSAVQNNIFLVTRAEKQSVENHFNLAFGSLRFAYNFVKRPKQSLKFNNIEGKQLTGITKVENIFLHSLYLKLLCKHLTFKMGKSINKPVIDDSCFII